jgi:hypothetical protein
MSNSILNSKFSKWTSLLAQNPHNQEYKNKVRKYGTLMVRSSQSGGNKSNSVDELLRKIDHVIHTKKMNGGKQVIGYRNMRGGVGEAEAANAELGRLEAVWENQKAINKLISDTLNRNAQDLLAESNALKDQVRQLNEQLALLRQAQSDLEAAKQNESAGKDKTMAELQDRLNLVVREKEAEIEALKQQLLMITDRFTGIINRNLSNPSRDDVLNIPKINAEQANALLEERFRLTAPSDPMQSRHPFVGPGFPHRSAAAAAAADDADL